MANRSNKVSLEVSSTLFATRITQFLQDKNSFKFFGMNQVSGRTHNDTEKLLSFPQNVRV